MSLENHPLKQYQSTKFDDLSKKGKAILSRGNIINDISCDETMTREQVIDLNGCLFMVKRHLGQFISIEKNN